MTELSKKDSPSGAKVCKPVRVSRKGKGRRNLYYMLPGSGRSARKRYIRNMIVAVIIGISASALVWWLFWYFN